MAPSLFRCLVWIVACLLVVRGEQTGRGASVDDAIRFTLEKDARVSLAVYRPDGVLVRTLMTGAPQRAGTHSVVWDKRDRYGEAMPAGEYTWKAIATEGLRSEFLLQVGQNVSPAWERATGNHEAPGSIAIDATGLYRLGASNEGAHWGVKTDLEGRHTWVNDRWAADPWVHGTHATTLVKGRLFELLVSGEVYGYSAETGRLFTGGDFSPKPWNFRWKGFTAADGAGDVKRRAANAAESPTDLAGDGSAGLLVAAYPPARGDCVVLGRRRVAGR